MGFFNEFDEVADGKYNYDFGTTPETHAEILKKVEESGFEVVKGQNDLLLLDLDSYQSTLQYEDMLGKISRFFEAMEIDRWRSKSGKNLHVAVKVNQPLDAITRIALQACMGSDPKKECLSVLRWLNGIEEPTVLFRPGRCSKS